MNTQEIIQYSSFGVGVFGIVVAMYQGSERKKLKQYMYSQAWNIFATSQFSFGSAQQALKSYKEEYNEKINPDILEQLSKCDAYNITLFVESIRQIQLSEPKFDFEAISMWKMQGRISEQAAAYFIKSIPMKTPSIPKMVWQTLTLKIRQKLTQKITNNSNTPDTANKNN
jgi:hypothetical protein